MFALLLEAVYFVLPIFFSKKKFSFTLFVGLHHSFAGSIMASLLCPDDLMSHCDGFFPDPFV